MEGSYGGGGCGKKATETEDLEEEEVWAMINAREGSNSRNFEHGFSSSSFAWRANAASRSIPRGGGSGRQEPSSPRRAGRHRSSAPVEIPDWSKILRKKSKKDLWDDACDAHSDHGSEVGAVKIDDDGEEEGEMAPPHEYLARRLERTRIASHSMCEGVGRTLKGRDLRKIRNSILTKTGFIE
ncbi:hypothetical protein C2S51_036906 [Perilla frutescens var. frutescens]|nr:hypothetical protein C2S51_036906 [Perilla frutescens var. frutescens]